MAFITVRDSTGKWMHRAFLATAKLTVNNGVSNRRDQFRDTLIKFTDTSFGGSFEMNPLPQYTRYCDIRPRAMMAGVTDIGITEGSQGLGRYYSEAFDDNAQRIYLRMGVAEYNSLTNFYSGFYNREASLLARRGRTGGLAASLGKFLATIVGLPFLPLVLTGKLYRIAAQIPTTRYYYSKPVMPLYWKAVENMVNGIAVNMKLIPGFFNDNLNRMFEDNGTPEQAGISLGNMQRAFPNLFFSNGGVNIYALAGKAGRINKLNQERLRAISKDASNLADFNNRVNEYLKEAERTVMYDGDRKTSGTPRTLDTVLKEYLAGGDGAVGTNEADSMEESSRRGFFEYGDSDAAKGNLKDTIVGFVKGKMDEFADQYEAEKADGTDFLCLRVNHTGTANESFSNSASEPEIASKLNGFSSTTRQSRFTLMSGNLGDGMVWKFLESAVGATSDLIGSFTANIGLGGFVGLAGSAFVDIPNIWENSRANMSNMTYTMELRATSGHPLSILKDIYIPMSCVLAAGLPKSTGHHSYTSPFLVELWDKGRAKTRLGMITDISITRGVGNHGWTVDGLPLGVDITFTVTELSSVVHLPIMTDDPTFSEASVWSDYLATLGSMSLNDQEYLVNRLNFASARFVTNFYEATNPARLVTRLFGTTLGRVAKMVTKEVVRP